MVRCARSVDSKLDGLRGPLIEHEPRWSVRSADDLSPSPFFASQLDELERSIAERRARVDEMKVAKRARSLAARRMIRRLQRRGEDIRSVRGTPSKAHGPYAARRLFPTAVGPWVVVFYPPLTPPIPIPL